MLPPPPPNIKPFRTCPDGLMLGGGGGGRPLAYPPTRVNPSTWIRNRLFAPPPPHDVRFLVVLLHKSKPSV